MKKIKLFKTLFIPSLGVLTLGTIAAVSTSCGSKNSEGQCVVLTANADSTLELRNERENNPNLQYSSDGKNWTTYSEKINIPANGIIYLKGNNPNGWSESDQTYSRFNITGNASISGNVMGLLDNGAMPGKQGDITAIPCNYCFFKLFENSTGITSVSEDFLPATTLQDSCYERMFFNCISLTTAPELPATELAKGCYSYMFDKCASLTAVVTNLPATTLADRCYFGMFNGCTSLTQAPNLPATTLESYCYYAMFDRCTSLRNAPELPATTLAKGCYSSMFENCTSLQTAPEELPAATALVENCYESMFDNCSSLTTAPELPAMNLADHCYDGMFNGCTSLTQAPNLPATTLESYCYYAMFDRCTSLRNAPELPATTLAKGCYVFMFSDCTSLQTAPDLPATTLAESCYVYMFSDCSSLNSIKIGYTGTVAEAPSDAFSNWVEGVANTGTFYYNGPSSAQDFGFPSGWGKA